MQTFFNNPQGLQHGTLYSPTWDYAKDGLLRNLEKVTSYYKTRPFTVRSQHILVRLLNSIGVSQEISLERYYDIVDAKSLNIGMHFKMTSSISTGAIFNGVFYGPGSKEILIATNDSFNPFAANKNWRNVRAVTALLHTKSDLDLMLADGTNKSYAEGISVVAINIPLLAIQYRAFCNEQYVNMQRDGNSPHTAAQFIHMYVLPNLLYSQLDMALFNRFNCLLKGEPFTTNSSSHPFFLLDYSKYIDNYYLKVIDYLDKSERDFENIMQLIPMVSSKDLVEALMLPDWVSTRQVRWAEIVSRLKAIDLLTLLAPEAGNKRNRSEVNMFLREFKLAEQEGIFRSLPFSIRDDVVSEVEVIRHRVGTEQKH